MITRNASVEILDGHERADFCCGVETLDTYFRNQASQDVRKSVATCFVLTLNHGKKPIGFYTLAATTIFAGELPRDVARKLPRYPVLPATLLGRMAIAEEYQRNGWGEFLLMDALRRSLEGTRNIGSLAVVVDAKTEDASRFYLRYGFLQLPEAPLRMFLPMKTIQGLFD